MLHCNVASHWLGDSQNDPCLHALQIITAADWQESYCAH